MKFPVSFLIALFVANGALAQSTTNAPLTPTEKWVVDQLSNGNIADFKTKFPQENDRQISPKFLEDLLTNAVPGVKTHRKGLRINGAIINGPVDLANAQIPSEIWLNHCQFIGPVIFHHANFARALSLEGTLFKADADFNSIKVGGDLFIQGAVFEGSANFYSADVARLLFANETQFRNANSEANFNDLKALAASFNNACFGGPAGFVSANIRGNFEAEKIEFRNSKEPVSFNSVKIGGSALLQSAVFEGPVDFIAASVTKHFEAREAQFNNEEGGASFNSMKAGHAWFNQAVFKGAADFIAMEVPNELHLNEAEFRNEKKMATFNSANIGRGFFYKAVFEGSLNLGFAQFSFLEMSGATWPKQPESFVLTGMSYKSIRADNDEPKSHRELHRELLEIVRKAEYSVDVYGNLEAFLLRQGYRADADRAFIAGKRRECEKLQGLAWVGSWLLYLLTGYGRHPFLTSIPCIILVILGAILFAPRKMELQTATDTPRIYNRFWYSLGLFLPLVDLQSANVWKPKNEYWFLRHYMRVQILLGWILIPLVVVAIAGLIK